MATTETYPTPAEGWTCFHCGTHFAGTFKGWQEALYHFGEDFRGDAWCQYTARQVRAMESLLRGYQREDTPRDKYLNKLQAEHAVALRRAEEEGYARGLRDASEQSAIEREIQTDGTGRADADKLRLWRTSQSQSDVNRSALADGCIAERANSLLPTSTSGENHGL